MFKCDPEELVPPLGIAGAISNSSKVYVKDNPTRCRVLGLTGSNLPDPAANEETLNLAQRGAVTNKILSDKNGQINYLDYCSEHY